MKMTPVLGGQLPWVGGQTDTGGEILRKAKRPSRWNGLYVILVSKQFSYLDFGRPKM